MGTDILAIGNAIVDVIARVDDSFLAAQGMDKGAMTLIDAARAESIYAALPPAIETSGGSAANTAAAAAALGASVRFIGKVAEDQLGQVFAHDIRAIGVAFDTPKLAQGAPTARCLIAVTPDGQRTMNTFLGACVALTDRDVDPAAVAGAAVTYLEGYLFDPPAAQVAFRLAVATARAAGRKVALTLSDAFCVDRHRGAFLELMMSGVDILFANEREILSLFRTSDWNAAVSGARGLVPIAALTRSEHGSIIVADGAAHVIPAQPTEVVDTTGAGDAYAAGFLAAYTRGLPLPECGRWGAVAAAEVISHLGPRPQADLKERVAG